MPELSDDLRPIDEIKKRTQGDKIGLRHRAIETPEILPVQENETDEGISTPSIIDDDNEDNIDREETASDGKLKHR